MLVVTPIDHPLGIEREKPDWLQTTVVGFYRMPIHGGRHDLHYHDYNQLYFITRGQAKLVNAGQELYVRAGDIVCIKAGDDHDILEIYGDDDLEKFWLYEPTPMVDKPRVGHLHPDGEVREAHPVWRQVTPDDFPTGPPANAVGPGNEGPTWLETPHVSYSRYPRKGAKHTLHHHDFNQLYLIGRGKAKVVVSGQEFYVQTGDIVCIQAGQEHAVVETYGAEELEKFAMYEPFPAQQLARIGRLTHGDSELLPHVVPNKRVPDDFPDETELPQRICAPPI